VCGEANHASWECPKQQAVEAYQLPDDIKAKVDAQYQRDVARYTGETGLEDEYKSFLKVGRVLRRILTGLVINVLLLISSLLWSFLSLLALLVVCRSWVVLLLPS
jgi:hypothetical protein